MLLGLRLGGTHEKTIRQIARNLETCGGYFFFLASPKRRNVSRGWRRSEAATRALSRWLVGATKTETTDPTTAKGQSQVLISSPSGPSSQPCDWWCQVDPPGPRPTARAKISPVRHSNPDPDYLRAAAGTSPVVACPPAATPRGHVHQWINALKPNNRARLCKLVQRPRPFQAGHACSASRSPVPKSDLDPASDPRRRASLHGCPGKRRAISVGVHYSPRFSKRAGESDAAGMASQAPSGRHLGAGIFRQTGKVVRGRASRDSNAVTLSHVTPIPARL